jgi:hypothetical protein
MKIELEFNPPDENERSSVCIILNPSGESPTSGLPMVTKNLKSFEEVETQLLVLEKQMGKIRKEAGKFFKVPVKDA